MKLAEIEALAEGLAPVIRDLMAAALKPLVDENAELKRELGELRGVDHAELIRSAVSEAVAAIPVPDLSIFATKEALGVVASEFQTSDKLTDDTLVLIDNLAKTVAAIPPAPELPDIPALVAEAVAAIPLPKDGAPGERGADGAPGERGSDGAPGRDGVDGKDGEQGREGPPGKLAIVKAYAPGVHYEADVVAHNGGTYQALKDTAEEPGTDDWLCLAAPGRDGTDGRSLRIRGTHAEGVEYKALDIVALNGGSFVAKSDNPGPCPGPGWQLLASQGKSGKPGERGIPGRGDKGDAGPPVAAMHVNGEGLLTIVNADGTAVECDLYPLLAKVN